MFTPINPDTLAAPKGFSNGMLSAPGGRTLFVAGQVGWDAQKHFAGGLARQFRQALSNALEVVKAAGGTAEQVGRMTIYVVDKSEYEVSVKEVGTYYRELMGKHYPAMALVEVKGLLEPLARVEIEVTAIL